MKQIYFYFIAWVLLICFFSLTDHCVRPAPMCLLRFGPLVRNPVIKSKVYQMKSELMTPSKKKSWNSHPQWSLALDNLEQQQNSLLKVVLVLVMQWFRLLFIKSVPRSSTLSCGSLAAVDSVTLWQLFGNTACHVFFKSYTAFIIGIYACAYRFHLRPRLKYPLNLCLEQSWSSNSV